MNIKDCIKSAKNFFTAQNYEGAIEVLNKVDNSEEKNLNFLILLSASHEKLRNYDESLRHLNHALKLKNDSLQVWLGLVSVFMQDTDKYYFNIIHSVYKLISESKLNLPPQKRPYYVEIFLKTIVTYRIEVPRLYRPLVDIATSAFEANPNHAYSLDIMIRANTEKLLYIMTPFLHSTGKNDLVTKLELLLTNAESSLVESYDFLSTSINLAKISLRIYDALSCDRKDADTFRDLLKKILYDITQTNIWINNNDISEPILYCLAALIAFNLRDFNQCDYLIRKVLNHINRVHIETQKDVKNCQLIEFDPPFELRPARSPLRYIQDLKEELLRWSIQLLMVNASDSNLKDFSESAAMACTAAYTQLNLPIELKPLIAECWFVAGRINFTLYHWNTADINDFLESFNAISSPKMLYPEKYSDPAAMRIFILILVFIKNQEFSKKINLKINTKEEISRLLAWFNKRFTENIPSGVSSGSGKRSQSYWPTARELYLLAYLLFLEDPQDYNQDIPVILKKSMEHDPNYFAAYYLMGKFYKVINEHGKSLENYEKAYELMPISPELTHEFAMILCEYKNFEAVVNLYQDIDSSRFTEVMWRTYGLACLQISDDVTSVQCFQKLVLSDSKNPLYWELLAKSYMLRQSYETSLKSCMNGLSIEKNRVSTLFLVAKNYMLMNKLSVAEKKFEELISDYKFDFNCKREMSFLSGCVKDCLEIKISKMQEYLDEYSLLDAVKVFEEATDISMKFLKLADIRNTFEWPIWFLEKLAFLFIKIGQVEKTDLSINIPRCLIEVYSGPINEDLVKVESDSLLKSSLLHLSIEIEKLDEPTEKSTFHQIYPHAKILLNLVAVKFLLVDKDLIPFIANDFEILLTSSTGLLKMLDNAGKNQSERMMFVKLNSINWLHITKFSQLKLKETSGRMIMDDYRFAAIKSVLSYPQSLSSSFVLGKIALEQGNDKELVENMISHCRSLDIESSTSWILESIYLLKFESEKCLSEKEKIKLSNCLLRACSLHPETELALSFSKVIMKIMKDSFYCVGPQVNELFLNLQSTVIYESFHKIISIKDATCRILYERAIWLTLSKLFLQALHVFQDALLVCKCEDLKMEIHCRMYLIQLMIGTPPGQIDFKLTSDDFETYFERAVENRSLVICLTAGIFAISISSETLLNKSFSLRPKYLDGRKFYDTVLIMRKYFASSLSLETLKSSNNLPNNPFAAKISFRLCLLDGDNVSERSIRLKNINDWFKQSPEAFFKKLDSFQPLINSVELLYLMKSESKFRSKLCTFVSKLVLLYPTQSFSWATLSLYLLSNENDLDPVSYLKRAVEMSNQSTFPLLINLVLEMLPINQLMKLKRQAQIAAFYHPEEKGFLQRFCK